jgi:type I restriction-modification system DNA methylase subunit
MSSAPPRIVELVETFDRNIEAYHSQQYNETQLRKEFIDPFFEELGWDVSNKQGYAPAYRDVIHEDAVKVGTATKAPDYSFRIGGVRKFFLEAKKPSINIGGDPHPAYQLRRYAWSAKLPVSILTDFEEFVVYDCQMRPKQTDGTSTARIMFLTCKDYIDKWDEIADIFSKEAVLKGSFDKFAVSAKAKRGTTTVDKEFLAELEKWRAEFARIIALRNIALSAHEINFAVQRTIDRIIFLRMCEDRGIEPYGQLQTISNGSRTYPRLCEIFEKADHKYNSGLFYFQKERGRPENPDEMTLNLVIDDAPLKYILHSLYYPLCPYEFSVLPAEILGNVYEQFLGSVIQVSRGRRTKVEPKPEVKKAGGIYYTPSYIVDYIVKNTVGKLLEDKTPKQIENLKILDPACGSGSFLLGAYTYLLNYIRDWYVESNPAKYTKQIYQGRGGLWFLTIAEKKKILLNNIFGVDIDSQAVEVTKLSLLLKVLEGESQESLLQFHERALPDLGNNIKCGNSLIGPDFFDKPDIDSSDDELQQKINAFDWKEQFPQIFKQGGFDSVIGNPPYIPIETMGAGEKKYYQTHHIELQRKYDSSVVFILAMLAKLRSSGYLGFISSVAWQTGENFSKLREHLFNKAGIVSLVNLPFDVFRNAYVDTGIYILSRAQRDSYWIYRFPKKEQVRNLSNIEYVNIPRDMVLAPDYKIVLEPKAHAMLSRFLGDVFSLLGEFTISTQGLAGNRFEQKDIQEKKTWYPFFAKGQVHRYSLLTEKTAFVDMGKHPSLKRFYEAEPKVLVRRVVSRQDRIMATYTNERLVLKKDINPFIITDIKWNPLFVLGVLNSKLISYLYVNISSIATKDDFRQTTLAELRRIPIRKINFDNHDEKSMHDKMVKLVDRMLDLHKKLAKAKVPDEKTKLQRQINSTDSQIDKLVYELYNLTPDEIAIVEKSS